MGSTMSNRIETMNPSPTCFSLTVNMMDSAKCNMTLPMMDRVSLMRLNNKCSPNRMMVSVEDKHSIGNRNSLILEMD